MNPRLAGPGHSPCGQGMGAASYLMLVRKVGDWTRCRDGPAFSMATRCCECAEPGNHIFRFLGGAGRRTGVPQRLCGTLFRNWEIQKNRSRKLYPCRLCCLMAEPGERSPPGFRGEDTRLDSSGHPPGKVFRALITRSAPGALPHRSAAPSRYAPMGIESRPRQAASSCRRGANCLQPWRRRA
jgi:hypothetical protein